MHPSHMSNGREPEEMPSYSREQPHYDAHDQYPRGRVPSAVQDRSHHNQYDARDRESPIVSKTRAQSVFALPLLNCCTVTLLSFWLQNDLF